MNDIKILGGGVFDSSLEKKYNVKSEPRVCDRFMIEYYISSSGGYPIINDVKYPAAPGTLTISKPGDVRYSFFHFKCFYLHIVIPENHEFYKVLNSSATYLSAIRSKTLIPIFKALTLHFLENNLSFDLFTMSKVSELCFTIQKLNELLPIEKDVGNTYSFEKVMDTKEYIEHNYSSKLTLATLSEKSNYSPYYLQKLFKQIIGITPQEYILQCRIKSAKEQLLFSSNSVLNIALNCGFPSQAYFSMAFKKATGQTPTEFKKNSISHIFED